jgi:hypothetical protein
MPSLAPNPTEPNDALAYAFALVRQYSSNSWRAALFHDAHAVQSLCALVLRDKPGELGAKLAFLGAKNRSREQQAADAEVVHLLIKVAAKAGAGQSLATLAALPEARRPDSLGMPPLFQAVSFGRDSAVVLRMIESGFDPLATAKPKGETALLGSAPSAGRSLLAQACLYGDTDTVRVLLGHCDARAAGPDGLAPAAAAAFNGHVDALMLILERCEPQDVELRQRADIPSALERAQGFAARAGATACVSAIRSWSLARRERAALAEVAASAAAPFDANEGVACSANPDAKAASPSVRRV